MQSPSDTPWAEPTALVGVVEAHHAQQVLADSLVEHWPVVVRFAIVLVGPDQAEDVAQEVMINAWRKWERYRPERGPVRAWLLGITANEAKTSLRRRRVVRMDVDRSALHPGSTSDQRLDARAAVNRLPTAQRTAMVLFYYLDLPVTEIAAVLKRSPGTVKSALADGRRNLAAQLGRSYERD